MEEQDLQRMARFIVKGQAGCTIWLGGKTRNGYPLFWLNGTVRRAGRVLFETLYGPIPAGLVIRHTCDNRECLNPQHLTLGTAKDNTTDRIERGRMTRERNGRFTRLKPRHK